MPDLPSIDKQGGEGVDRPLAAPTVAGTSPGRPVAGAQPGVAPMRQAPPGGRNCLWGRAPWAFLNTCDHNCPWTCGLWSFLLVFLLLGFVYLLIGHNFR
ncbi:hypothetical protein AAC387_Pa04g0470 [Persea americana]